MAKPEVRLTAVGIAFAIGIAVLVIRAAQVQLVRGSHYAALADSQRTETVVLPARRGALYDRNGVPLATTQESFHVGLAPNELRNPAAAAQLIGSQLGLSEPEVQRALRRRWAYFAGPFSSAQVHPLRRLRGVHLSPVFTRFYPDPDFARSLLGRPPAAGRGAGGIERVFDSLLAGTPGRAVVIRDGRGRVYESPSRLSAFPVGGHDIQLTLDMSIQEIVENALAEAVDRFGADGGDIVVVAPESGEVLAVASRRSDGSAPASAFTTVFEPGSTAKIFAAAALLVHDRVVATDTVYGEGGRWELPHRTLEDDHELDVAWITLDQAIRFSSNIAMVKFASRLRPVEQFSMLRDMGFGSPTGIEYPAESRGILRRPRKWSGTTAAALAIGYEIAVTPLQLALAYAAIANDGILLRPTLVREIRRADGSVTYSHRPEPVRRVVTPEIARRLRAMLRSATARGGTGASAALSTYEVAGKTGMARVAGPGGYVPGSHIAVFASLFPADDPQLVMIVKLENPRGTYATLTAAPLTRAVLEQVLAAQTAALDRSRLARGIPPPPIPAVPVDAGTVPFVVAWPDTSARPVRGPRLVPDITGLKLREAVRRLHKAGLNSRVEVVGDIVVRSRPVAGDSVEPGGMVTLFCARAGSL
ncbi:MAG: penicillin-binding transpeptidase domain-containing protein [Gemmatimonadales bacterium]